VTGSESPREPASRWARRSGELGVRIRDLHERNAQLSARLSPPDLAENRAVGSTPAQAAEAEALAETASLRALEAFQRMAAMRVHAARAHDRAADLHELLAEAGHGDVAEHRERAAGHRRGAREDRAAADRILPAQHVEPPESGPG
jgi:hypothetical protein